MRVSFFAAGEEKEVVAEEEEEVVPLEFLGYDVAPYRFYLFKSYPPSLRFLLSSSSSSSSSSCSRCRSHDRYHRGVAGRGFREAARGTRRSLIDELNVGEGIVGGARSRSRRSALADLSLAISRRISWRSRGLLSESRYDFVHGESMSSTIRSVDDPESVLSDGLFLFDQLCLALPP